MEYFMEKSCFDVVDNSCIEYSLCWPQPKNWFIFLRFFMLLELQVVLTFLL